MEKQILAALIVSIFLISSVSYSVVTLAHEEGEEIKTEVEEENQKREVKVELSGNEAKIESELKIEDAKVETKNKFEVKFETEDELKIKLEYKEETEANDTELETKLEQEVEFDSIIEFVDSNGNGIYDKGEEVSTYKLDKRNFSAINYTTGTTVDGVTQHIISTQTADGVFAVILHVVGEFTNISNETVRPTEVKIDLHITGFNYTSNSSKLALKTKIESTQKIETEKETENGEEEVEIKSGNFTGFFSWKTTALVDGEEKEVMSTALTDDPEEDNEEIYLIYERGTLIVHDPKIGFFSATAILPEFVTTVIETPAVSYTIYIVTGVLLTGGLIAALVVLRKK